MNRKFEYNRSIVPELGRRMTPTPEELKADEDITERIIAWNEEKKRDKVEEAKRKRREQKEKASADIRRWLAEGKILGPPKRDKRVGVHQGPVP